MEKLGKLACNYDSGCLKLCISKRRNGRAGAETSRSQNGALVSDQAALMGVLPASWIRRSQRGDTIIAIACNNVVYASRAIVRRDWSQPTESVMAANTPGFPSSLHVGNVPVAKLGLAAPAVYAEAAFRMIREAIRGDTMRVPKSM